MVASLDPQTPSHYIGTLVHNFNSSGRKQLLCPWSSPPLLQGLMPPVQGSEDRRAALGRLCSLMKLDYWKKSFRNCRPLLLLLYSPFAEQIKPKISPPFFAVNTKVDFFSASRRVIRSSSPLPLSCGGLPLCSPPNWRRTIACIPVRKPRRRFPTTSPPRPR
jgi:hypothetical protein